MYRLLVAVVFPLFIGHAQAADWEENPQVAALFDAVGVTGTFVLYDVEAQRFTGHDEARANERFVPASTFKIPNSLIGLSVGAVESVDEVLSYGGEPQPFDAWERDMGLREAIALSNVPIYQELARRIGASRMRAGVESLGYGNCNTGTVIDRFWLDGPLEISALEQTRFLARLAQNQLDFPQEIQADVREIVLVEQGNGWALYGKSGWQNAPEPGVGWWVGWIEREGRVYAFALNMEMHDFSDAEKRINIANAALKVLGVLP